MSPARQVPRFVRHLAAGQPVRSFCLLALGAAQLLVLSWVVVWPCAACRASMRFDGHRPSVHGEGEPPEGWGNPQGAPVLGSEFSLRR